MVNLDWKVCFCHIPRVRNAVVDHMTKSMATRVTKVQVFDVPLSFVRDLVREDYNIGFA